MRGTTGQCGAAGAAEGLGQHPCRRAITNKAPGAALRSWGASLRNLKYHTSESCDSIWPLAHFRARTHIYYMCSPSKYKSHSCGASLKAEGLA